MPLTVIDIVLPVVMESQLESTLDILCILESYAKLMQEVVGFAYHGGLLILAGRHNPFDLRRDAGVLLRPSLPFPSWLIQVILLLSCWGSGGLGGGKGIGWPSLFPLNRLID
uniref:Orf111 n=1 Tax=Mutarda arvensis TaxID=2982281 RepID=A0A1D6WM53_MUTAR|nr:orf111 [Sinapis arvensis]AJR33086.1 orf111 [Sinapis arvensis]